MLLLDGRAVAKQVKEEVAKDSARFKQKYKRSPQLAVVSVGDDPASKIYLRNKEKACAEVGIQSLRFALDKEENQEELDSLITRLNTDTEVNGILVQLPMPKHFSVEAVLNAMNPLKDSDGFHPENLGLLLSGRPRVKPCTPFGVMRILEHYKIQVSGKNAVVIGRSNIVGKPMAQLLLAADASVTMCHSKTKDIKRFTKDADIVVVAAGQPEMFDASYFGSHTCVIDVGMHHIDGKMMGDVDFKSCEGKVAALSPVPGGVGQMTVAMLLKNTVDLAFHQEAHRLL
ncbi:MAG: bifunctional methylenetetrahydrofolate dehydrogenase/methenyltetrahydrofolate cyclohydrolase FolD [Oligoflexia bacterium]|nr:bifunctional methylenetetrahydrofolate dehydrogenase/methenyltetrahydrofolate cyclohydrolase FolD [Oligoflexia bacterium]